MKKRKVIGFFVVLLVLAAVLSLVEVVRYGALVGFISLGSSNDSVGYSTNNAASHDILIFGLYVFAFILLVGVIFTYLDKYNERTRHDPEQVEIPFKRKVIRLDLSGSSVPKDKDNF